MKTNPYFLRQFLLLLQSFGNMHCYFFFASKVSHKVFLSFYFSFFLFLRRLKCTYKHEFWWNLSTLPIALHLKRQSVVLNAEPVEAGGQVGPPRFCQSLKQCFIKWPCPEAFVTPILIMGLIMGQTFENRNFVYNCLLKAFSYCSG